MRNTAATEQYLEVEVTVTYTILTGVLLIKVPVAATPVVPARVRVRARVLPVLPHRVARRKVLPAVLRKRAAVLLGALMTKDTMQFMKMTIMIGTVTGATVIMQTV